jgi:hypothetical protein
MYSRGGGRDDAGAGTIITDINGDGLDDIVISRSPIPNSVAAYGPARHEIWLNDGNQFYLSSLIPPLDLERYGVFLVGQGQMEFKGKYPLGTELIDINGDGLPDFVASTELRTIGGSTNSEAIVWLNTGKGFVEDTDRFEAALRATNSAPLLRGVLDWYIPSTNYVALNYQSRSTGMTFVDLNGDGLIDIAQSLCVDTSNNNNNPPVYPGNCTATRTFLNTGAGFIADQPNWHLPAGVELSFSSQD